MKKNIIIAIIVVVAILGVATAIKLTNPAEKNEEKITDEQNPAAEIGEGEVRLTEENFKGEIREYKGVALVDMFSPTCSVCQRVGPTISEVAKETQGKYKVGKLNVLLANNLANEFQVQSVPTLIFFKDGKEVDRIVGAAAKEEILAKLAEVAK